MEYVSKKQESKLPELPETKEDIAWKYHTCEKCGTQTGYLEGQTLAGQCAKCVIDEGKMKIVHQYDATVSYGEDKECCGGGCHTDVVEETLDMMTEEQPRYCLCEHLNTSDPDTLETIRKECASLGCNICLSHTTEGDIEYPKHYNMGKIQPIDVIEDWKLDFRLANAVKYIARAGKKDPTKTKQDLEKALWYIRRFIEKEL